MGWASPLVFLLGVAMGTGSTISMKYIYGLESIGLSGDLQYFEKPLFCTWVMFLGMVMALPAHWVIQWRKRAQRLAKGIRHQGHHDYVEMHVPWRTVFLLVIPSCFDLLGTALSGIGLLFTTVSVYQLIRCSVIIVTALLKATVLKQKLSGYMWFGIFLNTIAMLLVSATSFLPENSDEGRDPRIGIFFILLSCTVQGSQYVFEEKVMTVDNAPPLVVVGMEGVWGAILMPLIVFPWAYILPGTDFGGCVENFEDTWIMFKNSTRLQFIIFVFFSIIFFYNIFCIYVTFLLNSIWHAILDNFRPVGVWSCDLLLYYYITNRTFGEEWNTYSWYELAGMIMLFVGTAVYNGSLIVPGFTYPSVIDDDSKGVTPSMRTQQSLATPNLTRSPIVSRNLALEQRLGAEFAPILNLNGNDDDYGNEVDPYEINIGSYGSNSKSFTQSSRQGKR